MLFSFSGKNPIFEENINYDKPYEIPYAKYKEKTGYDCAKWLIEYCNENGLQIPNYQVHSMNVEGTKNIKSILESYQKVTKQGNVI